MKIIHSHYKSIFEDKKDKSFLILTDGEIDYILSNFDLIINNNLTIDLIGVNDYVINIINEQSGLQKFKNKNVTFSNKNILNYEKEKTYDYIICHYTFSIEKYLIHDVLDKIKNFIKNDEGEIIFINSILTQKYYYDYHPISHLRPYLFYCSGIKFGQALYIDEVTDILRQHHIKILNADRIFSYDIPTYPLEIFVWNSKII